MCRQGHSLDGLGYDGIVKRSFGFAVALVGAADGRVVAQDEGWSEGPDTLLNTNNLNTPPLVFSPMDDSESETSVATYKMYFPLAHRYGVVQMDPVGMVEHFQDPIATAAAQDMHPQKYLVYLNVAFDLPSVTCRWFRYMISLIGTTPRTEDSERGLTADMVLPIYPNTHHPSCYRGSVHSTPPFPFPNCYHWLHSGMRVRIRRQDTLYDHARAFHLEPGQHFAIGRLFSDDIERVAKNMKAKLAEQSRSAGDSLGDVHSDSDHIEDGDVIDDADSLADDAEYGSASGHLDMLHGGRNASHDSMLAMVFDQLGFLTDPDIELFPLVDMWFELEDHLTADTISNPSGLLEERDKIMQIIHDARERAPFTRIPHNDSNLEVDSDSSYYSRPASIVELSRVWCEPTTVPPQELNSLHTKAEQLVAHYQRPAAKPAKIAAKCPKMWRTCKRTVARLLHLPCRCTRPPFLPFWP